MIPFIDTKEIITNDKLTGNSDYHGMKILDTTIPEIRENVRLQKYQFQVDPHGHHIMRGVLSLKGAKPHYRIVFNANLALQQFIDVIKYDPSDDRRPLDYDESEMRTYHEKAQSDFKSSKKTNMYSFRDYIIEGLNGERYLNLPCICGWQSEQWFSDTYFIAYDSSYPHALYGDLYLPKRAIMQSDGQTQTAALFRTYNSKETLELSAANTLFVSLEIELDVNIDMAGNSFADRNGRGTKKNLNLVRELDTSSPTSQLRLGSIKNTCFIGRIANGRNSSTSITNTKDIVDNNTITLMLLEACTNGRLSDSDLKQLHVKFLIPYGNDFLKYLSNLFQDQWLEKSPANLDPYRKIYVHGWPYVLKALGKLYFAAHADELIPILDTITAYKAYCAGKKVSNTIDFEYNPQLSVEDNFSNHITKLRELNYAKPEITPEELDKRLHAIDWHRYRKHWINITGYVQNKDTSKKTFILKETGEEKVVAKSPNVYNIVTAVSNKILSNTWTDLCSSEDEPIS